jgi:DNA-binding NtrC family response regulator
MAEGRGLDVLKAVRDSYAGCAVILLIGQPSAETEMDALKLGALDCLTKPLDLDRLRDLLLTVQKGIARRETLQQIDVGVARQFEFHGMIGRSAAVQELFDTIRRLAPHVRTLLITGETGTGKELVARAFHKVGPWRDRRFSTVNCSAVVDTLFESELFGHQRGAFTGATETKIGVFEHSDQGTLFLDEVGELPWRFSASARSIPSASTCGSLPPRTGISGRSRRRAVFAAISISGSASWRSTWRRCAIDGRTSPFSPPRFSASAPGASTGR